MKITWYGQSAFGLEGAGKTVFIDPFGDATPVRDRGLQWDYPPIEGVSADLLLITHEHFDHSGAEAISGDPAVIRSTAGKLESPVGEVVAVASEHDSEAGTSRGPNTIFRFELDGLAVCHFGDFGQSALRDEQADAIGSVDLLFLPVGGGPTTNAEQAQAIAERLAPRWVVPMHYRTPQIGFLEPADAFLALREQGGIERLDSPAFDTDSLGEVATVVPAPPRAA